MNTTTANTEIETEEYAMPGYMHNVFINKTGNEHHEGVLAHAVNMNTMTAYIVRPSADGFDEEQLMDFGFNVVTLHPTSD